MSDSLLELGAGGPSVVASSDASEACVWRLPESAGNFQHTIGDENIT